MRLLAVLLTGIFIFAPMLRAQQPEAPNAMPSIYDFKVKTINGRDEGLDAYRGKVLLVVNTASRCGFTPQYAGLEKLYERYKDRGFVVLAFPSNDFMGQEPGDDTAIKQFCELRYKTTFPLFSKIDVKGPNIAPLYRYLTTDSGFNGNITWNFNKFLVDRQGHVIARFGSRTDPMDPGLEEAVLVALSR